MAISTSWRSRVVTANVAARAIRSVSGGAKNAAATTVVTSLLVWACCTIRAIAAWSPTASWWITFSGSAGMWAAWAEPLTPV